MQTVSELEKADAPAIARRKFRVEEICKMVEVGILPEESGWELIDGEVIHRMTIGSKHAGTIIRLGKLFERKIGDKTLVSIQNPIHIDDYNEPEPDIAILKPREDFYAESHPLPDNILLLIEISDSTIKFDREVKKTLYAEAEIAEFWLVNLKDNTIECYSSPKNGNYRLAQILEKGETVKSGTIENLILNVEEILAL